MLHSSERCVGQYIRKVEPIAFDSLSDQAWNGADEHWAGVTKRMELAALAAWVRFRRQVREKVRVKAPTREGAVQLFRIDAGKKRL